MDKQKQIEEMARELGEQRGYYCIKDSKFCMDCILHGDCMPCKYAYTLYNAGYRKIPEGAVVLSEEEWANSITIDVFIEKVKKTCKEAAEKFAERLNERLEERKKICLERWKRYEKEGETDLACYWNGKENEIHCVKADVYEICKEIIGEV